MRTKDQILLENLYSTILLKEEEKYDYKGNVLGKNLYVWNRRILSDTSV